MRHPREILLRPLRFLQRTEWPLLPLALLILAAGTLVQWSVAGLEALPTGHLVRAGMGVVACILAASLPVRFYRRNAWLLYGLCLGLLVLVLLTGRATNNARRWIEVPGLAGFKIQPSEFMKLALVLALARWFADRPPPARARELLTPLLLTLVPAGLVLIQPDLGTSLTFGPLFLALAWMAGTGLRPLCAFLILPVLLVPLGSLVLQDYQKERIEIWWRQEDLSEAERNDAGYHLWHSKLAVATGGLTGHGWGQGPENRLNRLPERHNDFVFPVLAEEFGFLGASAFLLLYASLGVTALLRASRYRDPFTRFVVAAVGVHFGIHLVINVGVTIGLLPTTGLPLPMVSWGGSSMMVSGLALGLALAAGASREPVFLDRAFARDA